MFSNRFNRWTVAAIALMGTAIATVPGGVQAEVATGLGDAFGHQDNSTARTELIIFIRPQIIRNGSDAHLVAEEVRSRLRGSIATTATNRAITTSVH